MTDITPLAEKIERLMEPRKPGEPPRIVWEKKRFIFPRICHITRQWTEFFPTMFVGTLYFGDELSGLGPDIYMVSFEQFVSKVAANEDIIT